MTAFAEPITDEITKEQARRARRARRAERSQGALDPLSRYKALVTTLKMETDFLDLADKKARFALVIMSVLNAVAILLVVRGGKQLISLEGTWGLAVQGEMALYLGITVYYIVQAIDALRPRGKITRPPGELPMVVEPGRSMRVLFHVDIAKRDRADYRRLWNEIRLDNLIAELADQVHIVSQINALKYAALARLYHGVTLMTGMVTVTLLTIAARQLVG